MDAVGRRGLALLVIEPSVNTLLAPDRVVRTTDGGRTWITTSTVPGGLTGLVVSTPTLDIRTVADEWLVTALATKHADVVLHTDDGRRVWTQVRLVHQPH